MACKLNPDVELDTNRLTEERKRELLSEIRLNMLFSSEEMSDMLTEIEELQAELEGADSTIFDLQAELTMANIKIINQSRLIEELQMALHGEQETA